MTRVLRGSDSWLIRGLIGSSLLVTLVVAAIWLVDLLGGPVQLRVATTFCINVAIVLAFQLYTGNTGIVSFGHVAFVGIGAYVVGLLMVTPALKTTLTLPGIVARAEAGLFPALLLAMAATGLAALVIGVPLTRLSGPAASISTLAVLVIVHEIIQAWVGVTRGNQTFYGVPQSTTLWTAVFWASIAIVVARLFHESPVGLRLRASQEDEAAASAVGIDVRRDRLIAWTLSATLGAIGGGLTAAFLTAFSPSAFYFTLTFNAIAMMIIGGMSSVSGAVIGAAFVTIILELFRRVEEGMGIGFIHIPQVFGLSQIAVASIFILVMIFRRNGLMDRWELDELVNRALDARGGR